MSFISDIVEFGLGKFGIETGKGTLGGLAISAITAFTSGSSNNSVKLGNESTQEKVFTTETTRTTIGADLSKVSTNNAIPVVYGTTWLPGIVTDVQPGTDGCSMYYVITLCETTGTILSASGAASTITVDRVQWKDYQITFASNGHTSANLYYPYVDGPLSTSSINSELAGKIDVYAYNGGSANGTNIRYGAGSGTAADARTIVPNWGSNHTMSDLVFVVIRIDYTDGQDLKGVSDFKFQVTNTMKKPGDVLYDYMTNTRYGAGIPASEIDV